MNFRGFLLILVIFLSVLRICSVENPEAAGTGSKPSSYGQNNSLNEGEANEAKSNEELSDMSLSSSSSSSYVATSSPSSSSSSSASSSVSSSSTDTSTESLSTFSSKKSISSSELEQLVLPTVAPATPQFDTETITPSLSVISSVTKSSHQEKRPVEEEEATQHEFLPVSDIKSEEKETHKNVEKEKVAKTQESKGDDEKKPSKDETLPEKTHEDQSSTAASALTPEVPMEKKDAVPFVSVPEDKKEVEPEKDKEEPKDKADKEEEAKSKENESKDKEVDSITAELKQAEEETKPTSEEMPSFDEFKRQHLQEEEKQKNILKQQQEVKDGTETINKPKPRKFKQRKQNNYASIDCGAKILKANPEASNIFSILQDNRDLYMLNPCSAKIWFIVELCDNVQVKTIEIANFELFSSTPESFKVYVSGRYPTREWTLLGTFQARDERNLQSFPLDEPIYAKYIKVEMLSHFGSEHYCPLSLFRVFGISMMEELEDHEADGQDDADAADHDDDNAQVLPPDPSVKEDDKKTKSNILATVGDTLFNMVKVAAKKLTGVIDGEKNQTSDSPVTSTVAPSSSIVSSTTSKEQDAKPSIVTLIPSDDEDDKIQDTKQENKTTNATTSKDPKKPEGQENVRDNTTFYDKIDPDSSRGSKTTSAFSSCELFVRMLGHSSFGCMMGRVLYSKRKHRGFSPREESPAKQKTSARNVKAPPGSDDRTESTSTDKGKEDSKKNEEKKEGKKESEKVEEKEKKSGKEKVDEKNKEPIVQKEENGDEIISKSTDEIKQQESSLENEKSSDLNKEKVSEGNEQMSIHGAVDPVIIVQPSEVQPPIVETTDPSSEEKGTPVLTTPSVLTTHPSGDIEESKSTQTRSSDIEPTLRHIEKSREESSESQTRATIDDASKVKPEVKDVVSSNEDTRKESIDAKSTETMISKSEEAITGEGSRASSVLEQSSPGLKDTCTSVDSIDKSLIKPSHSSSASECKAPSIATPHKDVDVLEFKILDSAGREGTAHLEKPTDKPVEPDKPVQPDQPVLEKESIKETKEEESDATSQTSSEPSSVQDTIDVTRASPTDEVTVSTSSSSAEPAKPTVVPIPATPPEASEKPTSPPNVKPSDSSESISPLSPPPVDKVPMAPPSSSIEASISDDLSVISKTSSSAAAGVQGLASSGAQKESIFMRLTNRIKALEQNLTLSTLYMEKLNQKYRKIVEDMQKNFDKKVNLLTNATRKAEAVIKNQKEQISALQSKVDDTSRDMKKFNKQLKSLNIQVMERHIIGLFLEVILIMILFIVFRRWDRARIRRDILRESRMNGTVLTSHTEDRALGKILNGQLSGREQLQRSFANPNVPEIIGSLSESVTHRHKEEFFPPLDAKKKRNRRRPKSGVITTETSQPKTVSESTNQTPPSSLVSVTAGLLFSPARGILNGFKRSQSLDDSSINRKSSLPSTSRLQKTKSLNVIQEKSDQISLCTGNTKKGRIPTPPPPPSPQKYWNAGSTDGLCQKRLQPSSSKLMQKKGRGFNGTNPFV